MIKNIFWNIVENRLRSGWRVLVTWISMLLIFFPVQGLLKLVFPEDWTKDEKIDLLLVLFAIIATFVIWISRILIDKRSFSSLGLSKNKGMFRDIAAGYLISAVLVIILLAIETGFGWLNFAIIDLDSSEVITRILYLFFVTGLIVAWWENLFFVSYLFINFRDGCGFWCSFILNCFIFGLVHGINPNASIWSFAGIVLIHTYELFGYLKTKNLWLILGIHAGWNFFQGLAGFNVSGRTGNQIITQFNSTPAWLGGGKFGPEAGLIVVLTATVAFTLIFLYTRWTRKDT